MTKAKNATPAARRRKGEGSIHYDAGRGLYVARVTIDGVQKTVSAKLERDCVRKLDDLKRDMRAGAVITRRQGLTVATILDHWYSTTSPNAATAAPGTRLNHGAYVRRLTAVIGSKSIAKLTVDDVEQCYRTMALGTAAGGKGRPVGYDYLQRIQIVLRRAVADGVRRGVLNDSVARVVDAAQIPRSLAAPKGERRALTDVETRTLIDTSRSHRLHALFITALATGLRPGELTGLYWDDLHLDDARPYLEVNRAVQRQANNRFEVVEVLKTSSSYRDIGLPAVVVDALREHRRAQNVERIAAKSWPQPDLVFASTRGTVLNPSNVRREFVEVCAAAGVDRIVPYETRHSFATMLAETDMNTFAIADVLGHTDDRMLSRVYRKKRKGVVHESAGYAENIFRGAN